MKKIFFILSILVTTAATCNLSRSELISNKAVPDLCKFHLECDYSNQENPDKTRCQPFSISCERALRFDYCEKKFFYTVDGKSTIKEQQLKEIDFLKKLSTCKTFMNTR